MPLVPAQPIFNRAALEVGHITFEWSLLERLIGEFIAMMLDMEANAVPAQILDGNMDIRSKIHAAKGLAFHRHFDEKWLKDALTLLDHIDNNLRVRRNAVVHAEWFSLRHNSLSRRTRKTKIIRPQSFKLALETEQHVPVRIAELHTLRRDIQETWWGFLAVLWYMVGDGGLVRPATSPTISWRRYLRLAGLGNPLRNVNAVQRRQRKSSRALI